MDIKFPRIIIGRELDLKGRRCRPQEYIGNPKAIAAQTFKDKQTGIRLFRTKPWPAFSHLFDIQYLIEYERAPNLPMPDGPDWIMYPYAFCEIIDDRACLVWREQVAPRWIRHVRIYRDEALSLRDNQLIARSISASVALCPGLK